MIEQVHPGTSYDDTNYIFLNFVTRYFPVGLVGLIIAAIFAAAMSTISAELNSLATTSVVDIYRRFFVRDGKDRHYVVVSKMATVFWGIYAAVFASFRRRPGIFDRGDQYGGIVILRLLAGCVRSGFRIPPR